MPITPDPFVLIVAMEEAGEFIQACSKVYRHDGGKEERRALSEEAGDVLAMITLLEEEGLVDLKILNDKRIARELKHRRN